MLTVFFFGALLVAVVHVAYAASLFLGYLAILVGWRRQWNWTRNFWFRTIHLGMILAVVSRVWFGGTCPLTSLEKFFRAKAEMAVYKGEFIQHYLREFFGTASNSESYHFLYTIFFLSIVSLLFLWPPKAPRGWGFASIFRKQTGSAGSVGLAAANSQLSEDIPKTSMTFSTRIERKLETQTPAQIGTHSRSVLGDHWN